MIPLPSPLAVRALAALCVALAGGFCGWTAAGWRAGAEVADTKAVAAMAHADVLGRALGQVRKAVNERDAMVRHLVDVDTAGQANLKRLQDANDVLRGRVAAGSVRVRVNGAVCPSVGTPDVPTAAPGGGVDSGGGAVLTPAAGSDFLDFRGAIGRATAKLDACQRALGCITGQLACPASP